MGQSDIAYISHARRAYHCSWCGERIDQGASYCRWRWYDGGDAGTVKVHPECLGAIDALHAADQFWDGEFGCDYQPRGCNCGHDAHCERCHPTKEATS